MIKAGHGFPGVEPAEVLCNCHNDRFPGSRTPHAPVF